MSNEPNYGNGAEQIKTPHIVITFDPGTYRVAVAGRCPNLEFARYLLQTALESNERQIVERDRPRILGASMVPDDAQGRL